MAILCSSSAFFRENSEIFKIGLSFCADTEVSSKDLGRFKFKLFI